MRIIKVESRNLCELQLRLTSRCITHAMFHEATTSTHSEMAASLAASDRWKTNANNSLPEDTTRRVLYWPITTWKPEWSVLYHSAIAKTVRVQFDAEQSGMILRMISLPLTCGFNYQSSSFSANSWHHKRNLHVHVGMPITMDYIGWSVTACETLIFEYSFTFIEYMCYNKVSYWNYITYQVNLSTLKWNGKA